MDGWWQWKYRLQLWSMMVSHTQCRNIHYSYEQWRIWLSHKHHSSYIIVWIQCLSLIPFDYHYQFIFIIRIIILLLSFHYYHFNISLYMWICIYAFNKKRRDASSILTIFFQHYIYIHITHNQSSLSNYPWMRRTNKIV